MLFNTGLGVRNTLSFNYGSAVDAQSHIEQFPEFIPYFHICEEFSLHHNC